MSRWPIRAGHRRCQQVVRQREGKRREVDVLSCEEAYGLAKSLDVGWKIVTSTLLGYIRAWAAEVLPCMLCSCEIMYTLVFGFPLGEHQRYTQYESRSGCSTDWVLPRRRLLVSSTRSEWR